MKHLFKHIGMYLFISYILLISIGLPLHKRICKMPDMLPAYQLFEPPTTCYGAKVVCHHEDAHSSHHRKPQDPCCNFSLDYWHVDFKIGVASTYDLSPVSWDVLNDFPDIELNYPPSNHFSKIYLYENDSSPPLSGREILVRNQSFLL